ncbi:hypothetical protein B0A50_01163 [Salinomyces thailandicus]|uniref:Glycosyltransferase family 31 protein n=1 Tax=Salinomyces thailandicus TaxID=706561 RepID=A0A4U0UCL2_9PEZI|nr:hypothetical protein B0A50_01163 [Salinomyces thailandica]
MPTILRSSTRVVLLLAVAAVLLIGIHLSSFSPLRRWRHSTIGVFTATPDSAPSIADPDSPPCQQLGRPDDVVVVMRTGATEIKDKLPVHLNTTFRCYPDVLIFSDYAEIFGGQQVHDVLADIDDDLKRNKDDFEHYRRLQRLGRDGLQVDELHGESFESGPIGKSDNPGWRLDKWKFLPMIAQSLRLRPEKKVFVFVEPDTYIVWSNMVRWLDKIDATKPLYYGSEVQIGHDVFAHGGTGFVMTRPAMEVGAREYQEHTDEWHQRTAIHWAGDCILGTALTKAGVPLQWSWPMFQGGKPADLSWRDSKSGRHLWCTPALSYHHLQTPEIEDTWGWEQQHIARTLVNQDTRSFWHHDDTILHHKDLFNDYVLPNISASRTDWDNFSLDLVPDTEGTSLDHCQKHCDTTENCVQYSFGPKGCSTSTNFYLGAVSTQDIVSGWKANMIDASMRQMPSCQGQRGWIL